MDDATAELRAISDINDALARYCRGMDRMDDDLARSVWHNDGTARYEPELFAGTGHDFVSWVRGVHEAVDYTTHRVASIVIRVSRDSAVSEAYSHVILVATDSSGETELRQMYGRFVDRWSRRDGRWAIDHREYRRDIGYTQRITAMMTGGRRDGSDFSYAVLGNLAPRSASRAGRR